MTEHEWLTCSDPQKMLTFLRDRGASERKLRLFGVACCRRVEHLLSNRHCRKALATAERYADGQVTAEKLRFAWGDARRAAQVECRGTRETAAGTAMGAVAEACAMEHWHLMRAAGLAARCEAYPADQTRLATALSEQARLLRDIVANPFRPVAFDPAWRTSVVVGLARGIYEERAWDRLPLLMDALLDAGCDNADVLQHCRGHEHHRGCWLVDGLLQKA